jgi:hypothetical protein
MNLSDVFELKVVSSNSLFDSAQKVVNEVNILLNQGWHLIKVYTSHSGDDSYEDDQIIHYVLGVDGFRKAQIDIASGLVQSSPENSD